MPSRLVDPATETMQYSPTVPDPLDNVGEFVLAFHTPSYFNTPVTAELIAVCICAPVANLEEEEFTVPVTGVNVTVVLPLLVNVFVLPELIVFT